MYTFITEMLESIDKNNISPQRTKKRKRKRHVNIWNGPLLWQRYIWYNF